MTEYNERQLNVMLDKILRFEKGHLHFGDLIEDFDALLNVMEELNEEWKNEFHSNWFTLETYYALALDQNMNPFELDTENHISEAIETLKAMINHELK